MDRSDTINPALRGQIVDILARGNDMTIATVREDGFPQATTVSYVSDGLTIYFGAGDASQKAKNIARCNKVSITINCPYQSWDQIIGVSIGGIAERLTDAAEMKHAGEIMLAKFPQVAKYMPLNPGGLAVFRVTPKAVSVLDYSKGFGHTELLTL